MTPSGIQGFSSPIFIPLSPLVPRGADGDGDNDGSGRASGVGQGNGPAATLDLSSGAQALRNLSLAIADVFQPHVAPAPGLGSQGPAVTGDSAGSAAGVSDLFSLADPGSQPSLTTRAS